MHSSASLHPTLPGFCLQRLLLVVLLVLGYLGPAAAADKTRTLLVFGDSLSAAYGLPIEQGWVGLLAERLAAEKAPWRVVNASVSGETTAGGRARIEDALRVQQPALVIIELGANDGLRGLSLALMQRNLEHMILASQQAGARVLLIGMRIPPNYGPEYTAGFSAVYTELARKYQLPLLPFLLAPISADRSNFQEDNLHPTAAAQAKLLAHVWTVLAPLLAAPQQAR